MKTLAILSQKGGTGKTTLAVSLAVSAEMAGHTTALIDLDPQASAAKWRDNREQNTPAVVSCHATRLQETLTVAKENGATFAILDTAPFTESVALDAARFSEMAVIPCKPSLFDLQSIGSTINIVKLANIPARVVLNCVPAIGKIGDQARKAVGVYDVPLSPVEIGNRIAFVHALTSGLTVQEYEPSGKGAHEIDELYAYISEEMGV